MTLLEELKLARQNPNSQAFLNVLADAEGTAKHGYSTGFGGDKLPSLTSHPNYSRKFTQTDGKQKSTSAAGRYQFLSGSWNDAVKALGLKDFGPESQDLAALYLLRRAGGLDPVLKGDFATGLKKAAPVWASLPGSPYAQPKRSAKFVKDSLALHTQGNLPAMTTTSPAVASAVAPQPVPMVKAASDPGATMEEVFQQFNNVPPVPDYAQAVAKIQNQPTQEEQDWEQSMVDRGVEDDAQRARSSALSSFFGEVPVPQLQLPPSIDESINRYLAKLS